MVKIAAKHRPVNVELNKLEFYILEEKHRREFKQLHQL